MITQNQLKQDLHYNRHTGVFTRIKVSGQNVKIGDIAGYTNPRGYSMVCVKGTQYRAHRLAWLYVYGEWPKHQIDHINHVKDDNRIVNLRDATRQENHKNRPINKNNTSGMTGINWHKATNKWQAQIMHNGKNIHLGSFADKFEAICARKSANNKYGFHANHGERPNETRK